MQLHATEYGSGAPVALLHGLFGAAISLNRVQRALSRTQRAIAVDLRNHGASPHAPGMDYASQAEDVLETLAARDALPASLLGHSMGGKAAMMLALRHPGRVSRLLVADIAPVRYNAVFRSYAEAMRKLPLRPELTRAEADAALAEIAPEPTVRAFLLMNLRLGAHPAWRIGIDEIAAGMADIEDWPQTEGAQFNGPVLFVLGETSRYVLPEHREIIRALFPAARFLTIKNAGHWVHADNPAAFIAVAEHFLQA